MNKRKVVAVPRAGIIRGSASNVPGTAGVEEIFLVLDPLVMLQALKPWDLEMLELETGPKITQGELPSRRYSTFSSHMGDHESIYPSFPAYMSSCPWSAHFAQFQVEWGKSEQHIARNTFWPWFSALLTLYDEWAAVSEAHSLLSAVQAGNQSAMLVTLAHWVCILN